MSWDIELVDTKDNVLEDVGNYTYNVSPMYREAIAISLTELDGWKAKDAIELLSIGVHKMKSYPDVYKAMNPENGWGNYEGALIYLNKILNACIENPEAKIVVS